MRPIDRRSFLKGAAATAGATAGLAATGGPFQGLVAEAFAVSGKPSFRQLRTDIADLRDGKVRLWLPDGFSYRSFHDTEFPVVLDDGTMLPGRHDGMGAFAGDDGNVVLIRNHEVNGPGTPLGDVTTAYDSMARGGTTTVVVTPTGEVVNSWTSLNGTQMNCSGGRMPWGSWITCEETVNGPDVGPDFTNVSNIPLTERHGFIFEVPANGDASGQPITSAGRFAHEAVAFDPEDGILYLTEDNFGFPSGFYRYIPGTNPMDSGHLDNDGQLQMLAVKGQPNIDLAAHQRKRATYEVEWVDIDDPNPTFPYVAGETAPTSNNDAILYVGNQGFAKGGAYFSRLEGSAYDDGVIYFCATQGGGPAETSFGPILDGYGNGSGQVWAYKAREGVLQLLYESPGAATLDFPDNVTTSARGTLILCEDNTNDNYLRGLSRGGQLFDLAVNRVVSQVGAMGPRFNDEFAGTTFSPDGETLFVNIQASAGMSFAIWGPWDRVGV
jgi:secreted PhoX family phosphatase